MIPATCDGCERDISIAREEYGSLLPTAFVNGATAPARSSSDYDDDNLETIGADGGARVRTASALRIGVCMGLMLAPALSAVGMVHAKRAAAGARLEAGPPGLGSGGTRGTVGARNASTQTNVTADRGEDDTVYESWFHNFGKWTLTSSSKEMAIANGNSSWYGMNQIVLGRNASEPLSNYPLVGPTGCAGVERVWTAERYLIGDNEIHWVFDDSGNNPIGNISVAEQHTMVRKLHGDLSEFDQFMDFMMTSYVPNIDPYIELAAELKEKYDYEYKFIKGVTSSPDVPLYSVLLENPDGQIFEFVSVALYQESSEDAFTKDECWFRPVGNFPDQSWYTDYSFEAVDMYKLGNFLNIEKYPRNYSRPFSAPSHTSIASTDPEADAEFLLKYLGGENVAQRMGTTKERAHAMGAAQDVSHLEAAAGVTGSDGPAGSDGAKCARYKSRWLMFNGDGFEHFLHLAYHPDAKVGEIKGEAFGLAEWESYLSELRADMNNNVYDVFMDDHVGMEAWSTADTNDALFASIASQMAEDGVPLLTRREPYPGEPRQYFENGIEKFSFFFKLPTSQWPFQMQLPECTMEKLKSMGLPEFCDWDFCPDFVNYREDGAKLTSAAECGFSSNYSSTKTELPKPIDPPDDDMAWEMPFVDPGNEGDDADDAARR